MRKVVSDTYEKGREPWRVFGSTGAWLEFQVRWCEAAVKLNSKSKNRKRLEKLKEDKDDNY